MESQTARQKRLDRYKKYYQSKGKSKYQTKYAMKKQRKLEVLNKLKTEYEQLMSEYYYRQIMMEHFV
jgi:asparagine synthetase B (glutamine-hydrolysing)